MEFDDDRPLDAGQVRDRRGAGGSGAGVPMGKVGLGAGGGLVGLVVVVLFVLVGGGSPDDLFVDGAVGGGTPYDPSTAEVAQECRTGADANEREDCRIVGVVNSVQSYWDETFQQIDLDYEPAVTELFSDATVSGCGRATSATGPFYCPADSTVYMDLSFFEELTRPPFDATGGPFAQAYVVAHEYGHHVQNLLGQDAGGSRQGSTSGSVRLELQADCYAGAWAANAVDTGFIVDVSDEDIRTGLDAAAAVGDDRIQEATRGRSDPESFTHGTSEQRQRWFLTGYRSGDPGRCDTFSGGI